MIINDQKGAVGSATENDSSQISTVLEDGQVAFNHNTAEVSIGSKYGNKVFVDKEYVDDAGQKYTEVVDNDALLVLTALPGDEARDLDVDKLYKYSSTDGILFEWIEVGSTAITFIDGGRSDSVYVVEQNVTGGNA